MFKYLDILVDFFLDHLLPCWHWVFNSFLGSMPAFLFFFVAFFVVSAATNFKVGYCSVGCSAAYNFFIFFLCRMIWLCLLFQLISKSLSCVYLWVSVCLIMLFSASFSVGFSVWMCMFCICVMYAWCVCRVVGLVGWIDDVGVSVVIVFIVVLCWSVAGSVYIFCCWLCLEGIIVLKVKSLLQSVVWRSQKHTFVQAWIYNFFRILTIKRAFFFTIQYSNCCFVCFLRYFVSFFFSYFVIVSPPCFLYI